MPETLLARGDLVYLKWHDSAHLPGWQYQPVVLELGAIQSAGIVVEANSELLVITSAINEEGATLTPLAIPVSCITEVRKLE